jgi:hypothetical protein
MEQRNMKRVLIACEAFKPELEALQRQIKSREDLPPIQYVSQDLHMTPEKLKAELQNRLENLTEDDLDLIVLGYGLCSNAVAGLKAPQHCPLVIPRVHDCISLYMGSRQAYDQHFAECPGTYFMTAGWLELERDPKGIVERDYTPVVGEETAQWCMEQELMHYSTFTLINNGIRDSEPLRERMQENAALFNKKAEEIDASLQFFEKILMGPYDTDEFVRVSPGGELKQKAFL